MNNLKAIKPKGNPTEEVSNVQPELIEQDSDLMTLELFLKFSGKLSAKQRKEIVDRLVHLLKSDINTSGIVPSDCSNYTEAFTLTNVENEYSVGWDIVKNNEI